MPTHLPILKNPGLLNKAGLDVKLKYCPICDYFKATVDVISEKNKLQNVLQQELRFMEINHLYSLRCILKICLFAVY